MLSGSAQDQAGQRLAAVASIGIIMHADVEAVQGKLAGEPSVNRLDICLRARTARNVRLVRYDEERKPCFPQSI